MMHDPAFWVANAFFLFVLLVYKPVGRILAKMLDERARRIQEELDEAVRLREEAQALLVSFQRKQRDAMKEAEEILQSARLDAASMTKEAEKYLEETLNRRIDAAMEKITQAERDMFDELRREAMDVAFRAASHLAQAQMNKDLSKKLLDEALEGIPERLH